MTVQPLRVKTQAETQLAEHFAALGAVAPARAAAFARFANAGLPHRRIEAYHFTDLRAALVEAAPLAAAAAPGRLPPALAGVNRIVIANGRIEADLGWALPAGMRVRIAEAAEFAPSEVEDPMAALNAAFAARELIVEVDPGVVVETPVMIENLVSGAAPASAYARARIHLGAGARMTLIERHLVQDAAHQSSFTLSLTLEQGAALTHAAHFAPGAALCCATVQARLAAHCTLNSFALTGGSALARRQLFVTLAGEHSMLTLSGVALLRGEEHIDTTLTVDHAAAHCTSRETFRHIVDDAATGVFQGKIIVRPGAQKTDGKMMSKAILLADGAIMNNKPELEIFADDVVCGHGATVGALDKEQIFYCAARGIPQHEAEAMLLEAFAAEILDPISNETARTLMQNHLRDWLADRKR